MRIRLSLAALAFFAAANACSDEPTEPTGAETITLSASQAATIVGRIESFASADPALDAPFTDDFERAELGGHWRATSPAWKTGTKTRWTRRFARSE